MQIGKRYNHFQTSDIIYSLFLVGLDAYFVNQLLNHLVYDDFDLNR